MEARYDDETGELMINTSFHFYVLGSDDYRQIEVEDLDYERYNSIANDAWDSEEIVMIVVDEEPEERILYVNLRDDRPVIIRSPDEVFFPYSNIWKHIEEWKDDPEVIKGELINANCLRPGKIYEKFKDLDAQFKTDHGMELLIKTNQIEFVEQTRKELDVDEMSLLAPDVVRLWWD